MIEKFEKLTVEKVVDELDDKKLIDLNKFDEVDKKEATHKHICYHDELENKPCRRVPL